MIKLKHPVNVKAGEYLYIRFNKEDDLGHAIKFRRLKDILFMMAMLQIKKGN